MKDLRVTASAPPDPHLLRAAIEARLAGQPFPSPAEDEVAAAVADALGADPEVPRWR